MTEIQSLQQSLIDLANDTSDETLLAAACLVLRGEADQVLWPHQTEC